MPTESLPVARQRNVRAQWLNSSCRKTEKIEIEWSRPRRERFGFGVTRVLTRRECIGIRCCIIFIALEQSVLEQSAVERSALEQSVLEQGAMERSVLGQSAMEQSAVERSALEQSVLEQSAMVQRAEISLTFQCRATALLYITIFPVCHVTL